MRSPSPQPFSPSSPQQSRAAQSRSPAKNLALLERMGVTGWHMDWQGRGNVCVHVCGTRLDGYKYKYMWPCLGVELSADLVGSP
eukprot:366251-Chlamydomonas_euryale.AAC.11